MALVPTTSKLKYWVSIGVVAVVAVGLLSILWRKYREVLVTGKSAFQPRA